jgi:transposase
VSDTERAQLLAIIAKQTETVESQTATIEGLRVEISELNRKLDAALRQLHGKKSERKARGPKMPPPDKALGTGAKPGDAAAKRAANREAMEQGAVDEGEVEHEVPAEEQVCAHCGPDADFRPVGDGKVSELYDYVPGYFRRTRHRVHTVACTCGKSIISAPGPERATPGSKYGPGLAAWIVGQKCILSMPIHRIEKMLRCHGIPISRSTLNELLLRVATQLEPIYQQLVQTVRAADVVLADETPIKVLSHNKQGYVWVFIGDGVVAFRFSKGRAAETAVDVLGGTRGKLLTDDYSGYKPLIGDDGREAAACLAHIRRKFHEALPTAPEAQAALDMILEVYRVEGEVRAAGIVGTDDHLWLRRKRAGPAMGRLKKWLRTTALDTWPKSPLGMAIAHAQARWRAAVRFLYDPALPVDNNAAERALRAVAIGRKNFNGVGSLDGGYALAILYSLTASCEAAGVNPFEYLPDVIVRVANTAPEALTPAAWAAARA